MAPGHLPALLSVFLYYEAREPGKHKSITNGRPLPAQSEATIKAAGPAGAGLDVVRASRLQAVLGRARKLMV